MSLMYGAALSAALLAGSCLFIIAAAVVIGSVHSRLRDLRKDRAWAATIAAKFREKEYLDFLEAQFSDDWVERMFGGEEAGERP